MGDFYGSVKEKMGCGARCMQLLFFVFNVIVWVTGIALVASGIYMAVAEPVEDYREILDGYEDNLWLTSVGLVITAGLIVGILGFLGCYGAKNENTCMLGAYAALIGIMLLLEITSGALIAVMQGEIKSVLEDNMKEQVQTSYYNNTAPGVSKAWNHLQSELSCCGADDYTDYKNSSFVVNYPNNPVPDSCCKNQDKKLLEECMNEAKSYSGTEFEELNNEGCYTKMADWLSDNAGIVYGVVFSISFVQLVCVILALCLRSAFLEAGEASY